jgi:CRISPR-associated protein Cas5t
MLCVYVEAPFAACRTFTAGWYRPTAMFLTPSAAYGLLLNVAGIESRLREGEDGHDGRTPATYLKRGLHTCKIALGAPGDSFPRPQSVYQQLHNYPVGSSGAGRAEECRGNKYNITPVRREFLSDLRAVVVLDGPADLEDAVRRGLRGEGPTSRYGLPFLGDNSFLLDRLEELAKPTDRFPTVSWYECIEAETTTARPRATRLTILIDRADLSKTESALFAPTGPLPADAPPPPASWVEIKPLQSETGKPAAKPRRRSSKK